MMGYILIGLALGTGIYFLLSYNKLVRLQNLTEEAWSVIDVMLKKRHELIPALVSVVKGYSFHEKNVLEKLTEARSQASTAQNRNSVENAEENLSHSLTRLFAVVENYPDLKAETQFLDLQKQLSMVEEDIEKSRRYYNGTVREKNIYIESFPSNLVAKAVGFKKSSFFEISNSTERNNPTLHF